MKQKHFVSIRWLLIISFIIPASFTCILTGRALVDALHNNEASDRAAQINALNEQSREIDYNLSKILFLGLNILHSEISNTSEDKAENNRTKNQLTNLVNSNDLRIRSLLAETYDLIGVDVGTLQRMSTANIDFKQTYQRFTEKPIKLQPVSWQEAVAELITANSHIRLLITSPTNHREYIQFQQLVVRPAAITLYQRTVEEAEILDRVIRTQLLSDRDSIHIVELRKQAAEQREILSLFHKFVSSVTNQQMIGKKEKSYIPKSATTGLQQVLETSIKNFELFDDIRRKVYASTLLSDSSLISLEDWQNSLSSILVDLQKIELATSIPLTEAIEQARHTSQFQLRFDLGAIIFVNIILLLIFIHLRQRVLSPIAIVTDHMRKLAGGDIHAELDINDRDDEIGSMISALAIFRQNAVHIHEQTRMLTMAEVLAGLGSWHIDLVNNNLFWSDQIYKIHGVSALDFTPELKSSIELYHPEDRAMVKRYIDEAIELRKGFYFEARIIRPDGSERYVVAAGDVELDHNNQVITVFGSFQDITDRKRAEEEIRLHRDHLQDMVKEQTSDLVQAKDEAENAKIEAEAANHMKSEFLANMSHELRTPLHAIINFSRIGAERVERWPADKQCANLEKIKGSGERLLGLLNNLLDLSKLESGSVEYDMVESDTLAIIKSVCSEINVLAQEKQLTLNLPPSEPKSIFIVCDRGKIHQVILNLLSNAIKFTPEKSAISIKCHYIDNEENLLITVSDEGIGIPNDELENVFDKFVQSNRTKTGAGGTGLGLSICKEIIDAHGGDIWAENNPEKGAIFSIKMPRRQIQKLEAAS